MKRTQIQLDDATYNFLKNRAHSENRSMAALIRDAVRAYLFTPKNRAKSISELKFVASGRSSADDPRSGSVHHDDIFAEAASE